MERKLCRSCSQLEREKLLDSSSTSVRSGTTATAIKFISEGNINKIEGKVTNDNSKKPNLSQTIKDKPLTVMSVSTSADEASDEGCCNSALENAQVDEPRRVSELLVEESLSLSKKRHSRTSVKESVTLSTTLGLASTIASTTASDLLQKVAEGENSPLNKRFLDYTFDFENLVFEGGGNKGMAYTGALQVLEDVGIMKKIKRLAGASAGAMVASLVAIGFDSEDLKQFLEQDLRRVIVDHKCGYLSLLPNLLKGYGWNPGKNMFKWFGEQLHDVTGNPDITFKEVHERFGKELCVVVTNLNQMCVEYFHPKTTPNTPIRRAVRMSMALPGVFQSVKEPNNDCIDLYVDGGLLCNYPIHCYDGWWLSMDREDTFFKRLQPLENIGKLMEKTERFGTWNSKTIGVMLYSDSETELMKTLLSERDGNNPPEAPSTKLARSRSKVKQNKELMKRKHQSLMHACGRFMKELHNNNLDKDSVITREEFKGVFSESTELLPKDIEMLFGEAVTCEEAFDIMDIDRDDEISFQELMSFIEKTGVHLQTRFLGYHRREIKHLGDFISTLQAALSVNVKRVFVEERDADRTIGIDTDYIETTDFNLEADDKKFLVECGVRATRAFLKEYTSSHSVEKLPQQNANGHVKKSSKEAREIEKVMDED